MPIDTTKIIAETFIERIEYYHSLSSTNDLAMQSARQRNDDRPLLIAADQQVAGRGRNTNRWWTGPGALTVSLLLPAKLLETGERRSPLAALAVAVSVVDAIAPLLPAHRVGIRWPNDVLVHDSAGLHRKLAGILVEVLPDRQHIIGIGLNTNNTLADAPPDLQKTVGTLRDLTGEKQDQTAVLVNLLHCLERDFAMLRTDSASIASRAHALCIQCNHMLTVESGNQTVVGRCRGIGPDGALLLDTPSGILSVVSGIVRQYS